MGKLPFSVNNTERHIFVGRSGAEMEQNGFVISRFLDNLVGGSFGFINEIWVEDIELVSLDNLWRRVVDTEENVNERGK